MPHQPRRLIGSVKTCVVYDSLEMLPELPPLTRLVE
jgi:hypothetical protein